MEAMSPAVARLRHGNERAYGVILAGCGGPIWILLAIAVVAQLALKPVAGILLLFELAIVVLVVLAGAAWFRAHAFGNMVLLGEQQFPDLHRRVTDGAATLGLTPAPAAFLYNGNGLMNAFARRLLGGRYVFLTSALVEAQTDAQVQFVIGHELGHHAAGHLDPFRTLLKLPGHAVPFPGPAYSRSRAFTCDRVGAYLSGDAEAARAALQMLGCGCRRLNAAMNTEAFIAQEALVPPVFGFLTEIFRSHPRLTRRVRAIRYGVTAAGVNRNPASAPAPGEMPA